MLPDSRVERLVIALCFERLEFVDLYNRCNQSLKHNEIIGDKTVNVLYRLVSVGSDKKMNSRRSWRDIEWEKTVSVYTE